jgi:hypothetical protein
VTGRSLLEFLDAPVVVGDPDGNAVYANPAFVARFQLGSRPLLGTSRASRFEGGAREALLHSVAECCEKGQGLRFRVRERGVGFTALASPIADQGQRFGVILMLVEETIAEERLLSYQREIQEPIEELSAVLEEVFEETGGRRDGNIRDRVERALRALDHLRKWTEALHHDAAGEAKRGQDGAFDALRTIRNAAAGLARGDGSSPVELLLPAELPRVRGSGARFEAALASLLRDRVEHSGSELTLAAKLVGRGERAGVVISVTESAEPEESPTAPPDVVLDVLTATGATIRTTCEAGLGRTTSIRLPLA